MFLNDASELYYGRDLLNQVVHEFPSGRVTSRSKIVLHAAPPPNAISIGVFSLSEVGDDLSQWHGYAKQGGYALGFTPEALRGLRKAGGRLRPVIYDRQLQRRLARECITMLRARIGRTSNNEWTHQRLMHEAGHFGVMATLATIRTKHPQFASEREWRITTTIGRDDLRFRASSQGLVPYGVVSFEGERIVLEGLRIKAGPTAKPFLAAHAADLLLWQALGPNRNKKPLVRVSMSEVPYRDW